MLKIEFLQHSHSFFTVWSEVEMQYLNYFQNALGGIFLMRDGKDVIVPVV